MSKMQKDTRLINALIGIGTLLAVVLADQITKSLIVGSMELNSSVDLIKGVLKLTYITNRGSAFGMFADRRWVFMVLSVIGICAMIAYAVIYLAKLSRPMMVSIALIAGGGIGNMIDRMFNGSSFGDGTVVDFIDFCAFPKIWTYIFNVADACVCIGCALFVLVLIIGEIKDAKKRKIAAERPALNKQDTTALSLDSTDGSNISESDEAQDKNDNKTDQQ